MKRHNVRAKEITVSLFWTDQFWMPHIKKDIDKLVYAQWETRLKKDPVALPGEEEQMEFRDVKYGEEKTKVDK